MMIGAQGGATMAPPPNAGDGSNTNDDPLGGMDPMAWLESLAKRQGANPDELVTSANLDIPTPPADTVVDEPGYTPGYDTGKAKPAQAEPPKAVPPKPPIEPVKPAAVPAMPEPVASTAPTDSSDDLLGGMDPLAWLESLAARQGANPDELITAANLDIPQPSADAVVDEPGYVDYDPFGGARAAEAPRVAETPSAPQPVASAAPSGGSDDVLGGMDPLAWLESLAKRQGANPDELVTGGTLELPPEKATIDQATHVDFAVPAKEEPAPAMSVEEAAELLGVGTTASGTPITDDPLGGMDPLAWLESLAKRQGANPDELVTGGTLELPPTPAEQVAPDYSPFAATDMTGATMAPESALSWLEELAKDQAPSLEGISFEAIVTPAETTPREAGGMSNDINEVQAWLDSQARDLELTREALEREETGEDLPPAEAAELPSWLVESISQIPAAAPATPALSNDIVTPVAPSDLPSWLAEPEAEPALDFDTDFMQSLAAAAPPSAVPSTPPPGEAAPPPAEIEAITRPTSPAEVDSWAEALDEEYERRLAGDDSVPDWYMEALARAESEVPMREESISEMPTVRIEDQSTTILRPAAAPEPAAAMPDWLSAAAEPDEAAALQGEIPDWLRSMSPAETPAPAAAPVDATATDWLAGVDAVDETEIPDWLRPAAPEKAPEPVQQPVQQAPTPQPEPVKPAQPAPAAQPAAQKAPEPARPEPVRMPPAATPAEYRERLQKAREQTANNQYAASLEHYQALIDGSQLLEETRGDLRQLSEQNPSDPKLRRLLGDTHMRLGDLQAALDSYRSALDQL
jgi:chemotaxis protein histidine kinase CheA